MQGPVQNTLAELPAFDLNALRAEMQRVDGGFDTTPHGSARPAARASSRGWRPNPLSCSERRL
jgi:hypothetical protein